jgi:hypothetical protein
MRGIALAILFAGVVLDHHSGTPGSDYIRPWLAAILFFAAIFCTLRGL